jgi:hypothetical protein
VVGPPLSRDDRFSKRLLIAQLFLQGCALAAMVWLRPPIGWYIQLLVVAVLMAGVVVRYRRGISEYRRMKDQAAARRARPVRRSQ